MKKLFFLAFFFLYNIQCFEIIFHFLRCYMQFILQNKTKYCSCQILCSKSLLKIFWVSCIYKFWMSRISSFFFTDTDMYIHMCHCKHLKCIFKLHGKELYNLHFCVHLPILRHLLSVVNIVEQSQQLLLRDELTTYPCGHIGGRCCGSRPCTPSYITKSFTSDSRYISMVYCTEVGSSLM